MPATVPRVGSVVATTARLVLQRFTDGDVDALVGLGTPEVVRYLGDEPWTASTARQSIGLWRQIEQRLGITTWAVRLRGSGKLIGTCGFAGTNAAWLRFDFVIEIGWTLGRPWWGRGLATEAARAALDVGLAAYPAERIVSKCHIDNLASERVMQRLGMRRIGVVQGSRPVGLAALMGPTILYRLA